MRGTIKWYDPIKEIGMITPNEGGDIFILSPIVNLSAGDYVTFYTERLNSGHLQAKNIFRFGADDEQ
jgi:cold shock CspA family protein